MNRPSFPSVSVCIPVYNGAAFLAEAVESVLKQTFADIELVVLDNASTDKTPQILKQFIDPRLRIIRHTTNLGATANFNAALVEARGEWVKILCADDLLYPDCLARQMEAVIATGTHPPVLLCTGRDIIDATGRRWLSRRFPGPSGRHSGSDARRCVVRAGTNLLGEPAAVLMRRSVALQAGGFDPAWRFCTDLDLWVRILQYGDLQVQSDALCAFRVSAQSWSRALVGKQAHEVCDWMVQRQRDGLLHATRSDLQVGRLRAYGLMLQRWAFYSMANRRTTA
jgi:glycosyltransferase involved in cell wall biosynthesis